MSETTVEIKLDNVKIGEFKYGDALTAEKLAQIYSGSAYCGGDTDYFTVLNPVSKVTPPMQDYYDAIGGVPFALSKPSGARVDYVVNATITDGSDDAPTNIKVIYLYSTNTLTNASVVTPSQLVNYYPVTYLDMQHVLIDCHNPSSTHHDNGYTPNAVSWEGVYTGTEYQHEGRVNMLNCTDNVRYYKNPIKETTDFTTDYAEITTIRPYAIVPTDDGYVLCHLDINSGWTQAACNIGVNTSGTSTAFNSVSAIGGSHNVGIVKRVTGEFTNFGNFPFDVTSSKQDNYATGERYSFNIESRDNRINVYAAPKNLESFLDLHMNTGAYLLADKVYKPIISGGWVNSYTDDLNAESELDTFNGAMGHTVPDVPPTPKTKDDGIDDMALGYTSYENGMVDYYIMAVGDIIQLVTDISDQLLYPHLIQNIVSLKSYSMSLNDFYTGATANNIQVGKFATTANGTRIIATTGAVKVASFEVSGNYGTLAKPHFLDYAPYTKLEVYIPFCGSIPLPPEVMYNTIEIWLVTDITSGSCIGVVKCNGNIVAQKSGIIGTQIPITTTDSAQQNYAMLQGVMNGVQAGATTMISGATGNVVGMIAGTMQGVANIGQQIIAGNENYTQTVGTTGDKSVYAMPAYAYLKRWRAVDVSDENYNRTYGRPCCKTKKLAKGDGFTIVDNPRVTGNMTLAEKNEIEGYLKSGVIL